MSSGFLHVTKSVFSAHLQTAVQKAASGNGWCAAYRSLQIYYKKDSIKPFNSYRQPCHLHLLLAEIIWCSSNGEVKWLQCYMMLMGRYFLSPCWLPGLGTPWHLCVEYQECCTGECPQKDHLAGGTKVVGEGRGCKKKNYTKPLVHRVKQVSAPAQGMQDGRGRHWPAFTVWELQAAQSLVVAGWGTSKVPLQGLHLLILLPAVPPLRMVCT